MPGLLPASLLPHNCDARNPLHPFPSSLCPSLSAADYRDIDAKWSQITEDRLNEELAARRLQPMIMYQSRDVTSAENANVSAETEDALSIVEVVIWVAMGLTLVITQGPVVFLCLLFLKWVYDKLCCDTRADGGA